MTETKLAVSQLLLIERPGSHFIVASAHREEDVPVFVFGRTLGIQDYADAVHAVTNPKRFREQVLDYVDHEAELQIWSRTYSIIGVRTNWVHLDACWPITPTLFDRAEVVLWDMNHPDAPVDELAQAITDFKEARAANY